MSDLRERLRAEGKDAFAKHYSLGMFKLCEEAADEIDRLRNIAIERMDLFRQAANNVERLDAEIAQLRSQLVKQSWQPIETAKPSSRESFLLSHWQPGCIRPDWVHTGYYTGRSWWHNARTALAPTHWMQMTPPSAQTDES